MSGFEALPAFEFAEPLREGVIVRRKSKFTMAVDFGGEELAFHCPTTGRVDNIDVSGRPCLVSTARGEGRKTAGTVEAISLARPEDADKDWSASTRTPPTATSSTTCTAAGSRRPWTARSASHATTCDARSSWARASSTSWWTTRSWR